MSAGGRSGPSGKKKVKLLLRMSAGGRSGPSGIKENKIITTHVGGRSIGSLVVKRKYNHYYACRREFDRALSGKTKV